MMQVWGKVTKAGAKVIVPRGGVYEPYLLFYIMVPYLKNRPSPIAIHWRKWSWEPQPRDLVRCTGFFVINEFNGKNWMNLHIHGHVESDNPLAVVPGVIKQEAPSWREFPNYCKVSQGSDE